MTSWLASGTSCGAWRADGGPRSTSWRRRCPTISRSTSARSGGTSRHSRRVAIPVPLRRPHPCFHGGDAVAQLKPRGGWRLSCWSGSSFADRATILPNVGSAIALIDRLIHHAEIITIEGDNYRRRAAELTRKSPRPKPTS